MPIIYILDKFFTRITQLCGVLAVLAMITLLINVFYDVVMRYVFNDVSIGMQELEWHLFSCVFLLGTPYAMLKNGHVRVDIFYDHWSNKAQAWVNIFGSVFLVIPFITLVTYFSIDFAVEAYELGEGSGDPGGLPHRWIIKSLIPVSFVLMGIASLGMITRAIQVMQGYRSYTDDQEVHLS